MAGSRSDSRARQAGTPGLAGLGWAAGHRRSLAVGTAPRMAECAPDFGHQKIGLFPAWVVSTAAPAGESSRE